ncbi:MAG: hypothetical protein GC164_00065 [Phycisphaera sp.]|nr:hypothetical protein [Phycisphaera sp.]
MHNLVLQIVMRYLHIVSAIIAVGGVSFISLALLPGTKMLDEQLRQSTLALITRRFNIVVWWCVGGLVVSGVYNWMLLAQTYKDMGPIGNALIGTKVLLALLLFAVIWAQSVGIGKNKSPKFWLMMKLHLAAIVILLASILRYYRLEHLHDHVKAILPGS